MSKGKATAITPTRSEDYPEWYQQVIKAADLAENSPVRGCMVIKPWGYGIWENIQREMDQRIKSSGHENAYFPLFIPLSFLEKEAEHVEGFAKECAVVTHCRLEQKDGKLVPVGELEEPLIVRPTSETIIGESFAKWVKSYRDLPLLLNQWANVVRWEMRPRLFLRTAEFLWQEGHTAHASEEEAKIEVNTAVEIYRQVIEEVLAMPVIIGEKSEAERFPGAVNTITLEAMMQDRKALQAGTSHYLGQNFAKASNIRFLNQNGELEYAYTTSWGTSTRLVGGMIMTHGDDDGLRVPPRVAPKHVVLLPVIPKADSESEVLDYIDRVARELSGVRYCDRELVVHKDTRDIRGGEKNWQWVKKGIPIRIEAGPRDIAEDSLVIYRRDRDHREKLVCKRSELGAKIPELLEEIQQAYFREAKDHLLRHTETGINNIDDFKSFFSSSDKTDSRSQGGFVRAKWCGEELAFRGVMNDLKVSIRCLPRDQSGTTGRCVLSGKEASLDAIFARAY